MKKRANERSELDSNMRRERNTSCSVVENNFMEASVYS